MVRCTPTPRITIAFSTGAKPEISSTTNCSKKNNLKIRDAFEEGTWMETELVVSNGRFEQILNSVEEFPSGILCRADLDGDRKDDYLLYFGEFYAELKLFLSSTADEGNGELLHYETSFFFPDCY
jgi:hypothetical protein